MPFSTKSTQKDTYGPQCTGGHRLSPFLAVAFCFLLFPRLHGVELGALDRAEVPRDTEGEGKPHVLEGLLPQREEDPRVLREAADVLMPENTPVRGRNTQLQLHRLRPKLIYIYIYMVQRCQPPPPPPPMVMGQASTPPPLWLWSWLGCGGLGLV